MVPQQADVTAGLKEILMRFRLVLPEIESPAIVSLEICEAGTAKKIRAVQTRKKSFQR
jgi:hypothetical protein